MQRSAQTCVCISEAYGGVLYCCATFRYGMLCMHACMINHDHACMACHIYIFVGIYSQVYQVSCHIMSYPNLLGFAVQQLGALGCQVLGRSDAAGKAVAVSDNGSCAKLQASPYRQLPGAPVQYQQFLMFLVIFEPNTVKNVKAM